MAIEIIRKGTPPSDRKYAVTCHNCRTSFTFLKKDAKETYDLRDGDFLTIHCPVCDVQQYISSKNYIKPTSVDPY